MPDTQFDLLTEPLIRVRRGDGTRTRLSLAALLAELSAGDTIESVAALRPHQQHAAHALLVQLAAVALRDDEQAALPTDPGAWRELLLALVPDPAAFCLVVDDVTRPAFLQPPVPEGSLAKFKNDISTPDMLDMLVTSKNFDLKASRIVHAEPDDWMWALVTLQTMEGYGGTKNYGIARMQGGASSRPGVSFSPGLGLGARFRRDTRVLRQNCTKVVADFEYEGGRERALLWTIPWDGRESLPLFGCDPYFIEICRRIRLVGGERIRAARTTTDSPRIDAKNSNGRTGDPWTPIDADKEKALTVQGTGFDYRLLTRILSNAFRGGIAQNPRREDEPTGLLLAAALGRAQKNSAGFHQRVIPVRGRLSAFIRTSDGRSRLAARAKQQVTQVDEATKKALVPALRVLLHSTPGKSDPRTKRWTTRLEADVDRVFFDCLERDEPLVEWTKLVVGYARTHLDNAAREIPIPSVRRYRTETTASRVFAAAARKAFPDVFAETTTSETGAA